MRKKRFATYSKYIANHLFLSLRYLLGDIPFILVKTRIKACALLNPEVSAILTILSSVQSSCLQAYSMRNLLT